jgi:hypothetical protein
MSDQHVICFDDTEINIVAGSLEMSMKSWDIWLEEDDLPIGLQPAHAQWMISKIQSVLDKLNVYVGYRSLALEVPVEVEVEANQAPDNVYRFPNVGGEE